MMENQRTGGLWSNCSTEHPSPENLCVLSGSTFNTEINLLYHRNFICIEDLRN
ncbi:hypothetical protein Mapa_016862 [Marchantia paleacea]|nr:hypothetical protein Mapa_016862 [Marchantia paleacea]